MHSRTFLTTNQDFVSRADKEMSELLKLYAHMKQEYASVLKFFGEDPSNMQIDEFFSTFAAFIAEFEVFCMQTLHWHFLK